MAKLESLPILFKIEDNGDVLAVFPTLPANIGCVLTYAHIGQHSEASLDYVDACKVCKPDKYEYERNKCADLLIELQGIYFDVTLRVVTRISAQMDLARHNAMREIVPQLHRML